MSGSEDSPEFNGFDFSIFGQNPEDAFTTQHQTHLSQPQDTNMQQSDSPGIAEQAQVAALEEQGVVEINLSAPALKEISEQKLNTHTEGQPIESPVAQQHTCNNPAHHGLSETTKAPLAGKAIQSALAAIKAAAATLPSLETHSNKAAQPATKDTFARRRKAAKAIAVVVLAIVGFNLLSSWAHSGASTQASTAATGLNQSEQISNIELVTADASLRREYSAVRLQIMRSGNLNNYQPTTGFAVVKYQNRVALVTSIGTHCWVLLADGNRTRLSHDSAACGPTAQTLLSSELRAGI